MELEIEMEEASSSESHSTGSNDEIHSLLRAVDVGFSVKTGGGGCFCTKEEEVEKVILDNISLQCSPGEMIAVMGPSGAGKTSFIKLLGRRRIASEGYVALGTTQMSATKFRKCVGYVSQETILPPELEVRELLKFYADMRLANKTDEEKYERIDQVLKDLGLTKVRETQVGSDLWETGGVSGGERKRVSIAVEMLSDPQILILDEPTSGLDASTSMSLCETLRDLARKRNKSILATIHQPRQQIFEGFTKLLLLSKGRVCYYGTTSQAAGYFDSIGYPIPPFTSVADHVIDCVAVGQGTTDEDVDKILDAWDKCPNKGSYLKKAEGDIAEPVKRKFSKKGSFSGGISTLSKFSFGSSFDADKTQASEEDKEALDKLQELMNDDARAGWFTQMWTILVKDFRLNWRDPVLWQVKLYRSLFLALLIGLVYLQLGEDQESIRSRAGVIAFLAIGTGFTIAQDGILIFHQSRLYYSRDLAVSLYDASSFYIATLLVHLPSSSFFGFLQLTIAYWMVGLKEDAEAFFIFLLFQGALLFPVCIAFGFFISVSTPNVTAASAIAPTAMSFFTMFGGTFLAEGDIPDWLIWAKWISPIRAVYSSCFLNEFEDTTWECDDSSFCLETGDEIIEYYGFEDDNKWVNLGILLGEFAFCTIVAYAVLVYKESKTYPR